ncbi:MAG: PilZ domain-containing protein [Polyangia bacterium]
MQILKARFHNREEFNEVYHRDLPNGGMFVATTTPLSERDPVVVELFVKGLPGKVLLRGEVKSWRPALPRLRVRAGALVEFLSDESEKKDFMLAALSGQVVARKRRHPRLPVTIPVTFHREGALDSLPGELLEISLGGAFLRSDQDLPAVGDDVVVDVLLPGGAVPVPLQGKVATRNESGVGLKFVYRDGGGSRRIRELIRRLKAS